MINKPNILFITTDQQNCSTLGCYGGQVVESPNIDRLANEGVLLTHAYVTCPLCVPSRGSIMSGRYPHVTKIMVNDDGRAINYPQEISGLSDVLNANGYDCAYFGKWHLGNDELPQHGFNAGWQTFLRESYEDWLIETNQFQFPDPLTAHRRAIVPEELAHDTYVANTSAKFITERKSSKPFALWCALRAPHDPYVGPYTNRYSPETVVLPISIEDTLKGKPTAQKNNWSKRYQLVVENIQQKEDFKDVIARYWGLSYFVDTNVGRVLKALKEAGLEDDTIVVFHSDHGDMMGEHNMITKGPYMYEATNRVPFIIRYPRKIPQGLKMNGLFSLVDIAPTILELAGIEHKEKFDGISAADAIITAQEEFREAVFAEMYEVLDQRSVIFSVRTKEWKYNMYLGDQDELYDMKNDPYEMNNLAEKERYVKLVKEMQGLIINWMQDTGGVSVIDLILALEKGRPMNFLSNQVYSMGFSSI